MSSRGVLVSKDSIESFNEFPIEATSPPPRTPKTPRSPHGTRLDYFERSHRGNSYTIRKKRMNHFFHEQRVIVNNNKMRFA